MPTPVTRQKIDDIRARPMPKPLDEAVWQAWLLKGRAQEDRGRAARMKTVKWMSLAVLLLAAAAGLWSQRTPYDDVGVRFLVAAGAMVLMFQAFHTRDYAFGAVFGAASLTVAECEAGAQ